MAAGLEDEYKFLAHEPTIMSDGWSSKKAFVLASIGAAVGIGNIWRFPYIATGNGGIWFLLPYFICLLLVGIPLFMLESGQGYLLKRGFYKAVEGSANLPFIKKHIRRLIGAFPVLVSTAILGYYMALTGWTLWFAAKFLLGDAPTFTLMSQNFGSIVSYIIVFACGYYIALKGISKGIEPATNFLVPLLFVFLAGTFIYSLTLPAALDSLSNAFSAPADAVFNPRTWYYALSQVLFSLSVGYGIMFTYGLHLKAGRGIFGSSIEVAGADTAASLLAFFTIIMISGAIGTAHTGISLSFEPLPIFFFSQGLIGFMAGAAFFLLLFSAAFTSVISMITHTAKSTEFLHAGYKTLIAAGVFAIGMLSALSYSPMGLTAFGKPLLDLFDFAFGTFLAPFSALAVVFACAYLLPHHKVASAIGIPARFHTAFSFLIQKVLPAAFLLLIIFSQITGLY